MVELIVATLVLGTILLTAATALGVSVDGIGSSKLQSTAGLLLQEELEPLLTIRDKGWVANMVNGTYYVAPSGSSWALTATTSGETVGQFTRKVTIGDVYRDGNGQIVSTGGTLDPSTKVATASVSWQTLIPHTILATTFLTRYKENLVWTQTLKSEFDLGTYTGTVSQYTNGTPPDGEVILGAGGQGDWCEPSPIVALFDLPKSGVANAISAYEGRVIVGTGENAAGVSLADVAISDTHPPVPTLSGTFDGYKTNDVFLDGNYAYLATDNNSKEVVIVNLTTYQEVGYFNTPFSNSDATSVYVSGNRGYVTAGFILYIFDLSSKVGSRPLLGLFLFLGSATSVAVNGSYAYVSLSGSPIEMQIIDISNPQSLENAGWADVNGTDGKRVFVNSSATRAYLATGASASLPEFFVIDITSKIGSRPIVGSYDASGMNPRSLAVVPGNKALLVGTGAEEYQAINIADETHPTRCGGMQVDSGVKGIAAVLEGDGDAYSYIVTGDSNSELKIIEGGPGGAFATFGTFESSTLDAASTTAFNRFDASFNELVGTDITFQVAVADVGGDGTCNSASFTFVGPDGTASSSFTDDGAIPLSDDGSGFENPGRCFRYKATLTTSDAAITPTLYDFTVNYSP